MFQKSSKYYDMIYSFKDYKNEAEVIKNTIEKYKPGCRTILDVACGTGEHIKYLKDYDIDGLDINGEFIEIAKKKNCEGNYFLCDMTDFHIGKKYDVIMCLFSSIGYVLTIENVVKTFVCFREHLNDGGIVMVEPWFTPDTWHKGKIHMATAEREDLKICRMNISETYDRVSVFTLHYLVGSKDGIEYFTERHEAGLFTVEEMKQAFSSSGLQAEYEEQGVSGRGLYIASSF